jgi:hypothetical protein
MNNKVVKCITLTFSILMIIFGLIIFFHSAFNYLICPNDIQISIQIKETYFYRTLLSSIIIALWLVVYKTYAGTSKI